MQPLWQMGTETVLNVVVNSQITFHKIVEVFDYFVGVFVQQSLELRHFLIVVEVLFIF